MFPKTQKIPTRVYDDGVVWTFYDFAEKTMPQNSKNRRAVDSCRRGSLPQGTILTFTARTNVSRVNSERRRFLGTRGARGKRSAWSSDIVRIAYATSFSYYDGKNINVTRLGVFIVFIVFVIPFYRIYYVRISSHCEV